MHLRKELLEAKHRLAELEPAWEMFIAKHNDEEEAQESEQRRRAAVVAQLSERRNRRLENEANRVELVTSGDEHSSIGCGGNHFAAGDTSRSGQ